jgi:hypothetical protein
LLFLAYRILSTKINLWTKRLINILDKDVLLEWEFQELV